MCRQSDSENLQKCPTSVSGASGAATQPSPLDATLLGCQTALDDRQVRFEQLGYLLEVVFLATEVTFADFIFSLSTRSTTHLSASIRQGILISKSHVLTYSIAGPIRSRPILAPCKITRLAGRLIPAARLQVATMTLMVPRS